MRKTVAVLSLTVGAVLGTATPAFAHQHLFNPSGTCPAGTADVPQGLDNPAGQTPGGRNDADGNEQGTEYCP
ncbi:MAG: hypothetical protein ABR608_12040 [Pseudonocardiaceae bacterium]